MKTARVRLSAVTLITMLLLMRIDAPATAAVTGTIYQTGAAASTGACAFP